MGAKERKGMGKETQQTKLSPDYASDWAFAVRGSERKQEEVAAERIQKTKLSPDCTPECLVAAASL